MEIQIGSERVNVTTASDIFAELLVRIQMALPNATVCVPDHTTWYSKDIYEIHFRGNCREPVLVYTTQLGVASINGQVAVGDELPTQVSTPVTAWLFVIPDNHRVVYLMWYGKGNAALWIEQPDVKNPGKWLEDVEHALSDIVLDAARGVL